MANFRVCLRYESVQITQNDEGHKTTGRIQEFETIQRGEAHVPRRREGGTEKEKLTDNGERTEKRKKLMKRPAKLIADHDKVHNKKVEYKINIIFN